MTKSNHAIKSHKKGSAADAPSFLQRLNVQTAGIVTLANFVTIGGLILSLYGIRQIYLGHVMLGTIILGIGRLADILDGFIAKSTVTQSKVGEALDAGSDKVVLGFAIIILAIEQVIPVLPLLVILAFNILNAGCSITAKLRSINLHPSAIGRRAALMQWLAIMTFLFAQLISPDHVLFVHSLKVLGYIFFIVFVIQAVDTLGGYFTHTFKSSK